MGGREELGTIEARAEGVRGGEGALGGGELVGPAIGRGGRFEAEEVARAEVDRFREMYD